MKLKEPLKHKGRFTIETVDARTGRIIDRYSFDNMLTNKLRKTYLAMLEGKAELNDLKIQSFAFGIGPSEPSSEDTTLEGEIARYPITKCDKIGNVLRTVVSIGATGTDSRGTTINNLEIRELGVFCGCDEKNISGTPGEGIMISRVLVKIDKNENMILNIIREDTINL